MRQARVVLLLAGAVMCSACFQFSTVLTVKGDGSGTIAQRLLFTHAAVAQLRQFAAFAGGGAQNFDPVSEQQARDGAATLGPGVTYVSSTPINTSEGIGRDITYAFTDINQLKLDEAPPAPGGMAIGPQGTSGQQVSFNLTRQPDSHLLLKILVPQLPIGAGGNTSSIGNMPSLDQMAMLKSMLTGARLSIAIEPVGQLVRTSSPYVSGQRVTLVEVNVDSLLNDDTLIPRLQAARTSDDAKAILKGVSGLKVNIDPEITIEFR